MAIDLDSLQARLRATADALQPQPTAQPGAPPVVVEVTSLPPRRPWVFRIVRDSAGRVESIVAEPA